MSTEQITITGTIDSFEPSDNPRFEIATIAGVKVQMMDRRIHLPEFRKVTGYEYPTQEVTAKIGMRVTVTSLEEHPKKPGIYRPVAYGAWAIED